MAAKPMANVILRAGLTPAGEIASSILSTVTSLTASEYIKTLGPGAYTTARTVSARSGLFQGSFHAARLADTIDELAGPTPSRPSQASMMDTLTTIATAGRECLDGPGELKIVVYVPTAELAAHAHISLMPPVPPPPVLVEARPLGHIANHSTVAKSTDWVRTRAAFADAKDPAANEVVPYTEDGAAPEGLSSNVFAVAEDGTLLTAPDSAVLKGSMRDLILSLAQELAIPIAMVSPNIADAPSWRGMIISSTSRCALPVNELAIHTSQDGSTPHDVVSWNPPDPIVETLQAAVADHLAANATPIPPP